MILAIVQARVASSRLPGKVLKEIGSKPVIGYLFERLQFSKKIDKVILATSVNSENDSLCQFVESMGVAVFRGSENNVLERYYLAAKEYGASDIVRLTGDCPLIDPAICDQLIEEYLSRQVDYAHLAPTFAEGLDCEIIKFSALELCYQKAVLASECEHVTKYVHNYPGQFKMFTLNNSTDDSRYRIVLDEPADFQMLERLFKDFYGKVHPRASFREIKDYLNNNPQVMEINKNIIRNEGLLISLRNDKKIK